MNEPPVKIPGSHSESISCPHCGEEFGIEDKVLYERETQRDADIAYYEPLIGRLVSLGYKMLEMLNHADFSSGVVADGVDEGSFRVHEILRDIEEEYQELLGKEEPWSSEWPDKPGLYWFYGWRFWRKRLDGTEHEPELCFVEARRATNRLMYITHGHFLFEGEGCEGKWQRAAPPRLPKK